MNIYRVIDTKDTSKIYVGKTTQPVMIRFVQHYLSRNGKGECSLSYYMKERDFEDFTFELIEVCSLEEGKEKEQYWIEKEGTINKYNAICNKNDRRQRDLERKRQPYQCSCGKTIQKGHLSKHLKTKNHS